MGFSISHEYRKWKFFVLDYVFKDAYKAVLENRDSVSLCNKGLVLYA